MGINFSNISSSAGALELVETKTASVAVTEFDFTGLDLNSNEAYILIYNIRNGYAGANTCNLFFNNDVTITNYETQYFNAKGATVNSAIANTSYLMSQVTGEDTLGQVMIQKGVQNYVQWFALGNRDMGANMGMRNFLGQTLVTHANVTSIKIVSGHVQGFSSGSKVSLYKVVG